MSRTGFVLAAIISLAKSVTPVPAISHFTNVREVHISKPGVQNYFVIDEDIWGHSRPDLSDLRIYDWQTQVQYALSQQRGGISSHQELAKILNLGNVAGHTEFDLDMGQIAAYDRVRLTLDAKDFVVTASVAGSNMLDGKPAAILPPSTLYDFTREALGSNSTVKFPQSSFHYLHIKLSAGISPQQVKGAVAFEVTETKTTWINVGSCGTPSQNGRLTAVTCEAPLRVPVDRVRFQVAPTQVNFRRTARVSDSSERYEGSGELTRVRLNRAGTMVVSEEMDLPVEGQTSDQFTINIDNGDNPPLAISSVQLLSIERRVYFDPQGKSSLKLFYGDHKLEAPVYDYDRFFHADPGAAKAELGPGTHNDAYQARPDDRPWSERHNALLWLAMILAVAALAVLAVRGLRAEGRLEGHS